MRRKFLGFEQQTDSFCTNEREYPLRLNTSQSHFIWWLAARQEMLSSSKYFLNTTKYLYKSPSPGFWGRKTEVQRGRHSTAETVDTRLPNVPDAGSQSPVHRCHMQQVPAWPRHWPHEEHRAMSVPGAHMRSPAHISWAPDTEQCRVEWPGYRV